MVHLIFPISIRSALHAVLIALAFQVQAGGSNVTAARADEHSETLYPGRYVCELSADANRLHLRGRFGGQTANRRSIKSHPTYRISANGGLVAPDIHPGHSIGKASLNEQTRRSGHISVDVFRSTRGGKHESARSNRHRPGSQAFFPENESGSRRSALPFPDNEHAREET